MKFKKAVCLCLAFIFLFLFTACEKTYTVKSENVYTITGEKLQGPSVSSSDSSLKVNGGVKDGAKVQLMYFGREYDGEIYENYVFWDIEPTIVSGSTDQYTYIYKTSGGMDLEFHCAISGTYVTVRINYT